MAAVEEHGLRKELGLWDLVLAQVLCVVGSSWVGIAAKIGRPHLVFWLVAIALFFLPLAAVVIFLNRLMPLEGGLYQWARQGFGELPGFLIAWNLWVYGISATASILFVIPTDLAYLLGSGWAWLPKSAAATFGLTGVVMLGVTLVALHGLDIGKWLHNAGSVLILLAYAILLGLPVWGLLHGSLRSFEAFPLALPKFDWFSVAIFGQITVGGLSGFEYIAILAGESRRADRTIGQSVLISAPVIAVMFILGTSTVLAFVGDRPINVVGPIPQTFRLAFGDTGMANRAAQFGISLLLARAVAAGSLLFTGVTRLPMAAAWDRVLPQWFTRLHPVRRTPVNSIAFVAALVMAMIVLSLIGVQEQESSQLLANASIVHYAIAYIALFALPLCGARALRGRLPGWLKGVSAAGMAASLVSLLIAVYPVVDVVSRATYAEKIVAVVVISNMAGILIYRAGRGRNATA
ncbi:MAG TPA: APC family permease [Candidatus Acidoferrales bacterium]|nr:APC family permease [Candidatus Acidoferrales bacterium]